VFAIPDCHEKTRKPNKATTALAPWLLLLLTLVIWQCICSALQVSEFIFPSPLAIIQAMIEFSGPIAHHALSTFWVTMTGFAIAVAVGVTLGFLIGSSPLLYAAVYPLMTAFNALPKAAFVPVLVVWFGIGAGPAILTAFLISFSRSWSISPPASPPSNRNWKMCCGCWAPGAWIFCSRSGLPRSLPYFFASLKVAITLAFVGSTVSEMNASNEGIGYLLVSAGSSMKMPLAFAGLVVIGAMAMLMYELFAIVEKRTTRWAHRGGGGK